MSRPAMLDCALVELADIEAAIEQQMQAEQSLRLMLEEARGAAVLDVLPAPVELLKWVRLGS